jgi:hypothetical protein
LDTILDDKDYMAIVTVLDGNMKVDTGKGDELK